MKRVRFIDSDYELTSELEGMLESGQAEREELAAALIREYFAPVYFFALAALDDRAQALEAVISGLGKALAESDGYSSREGVQVWLWRFTLKAISSAQRKLTWRRGIHIASAQGYAGKGSAQGGSASQAELKILQVFANLNNPERWVVLLNLLGDLPPDTIAEITRKSPEQVSKRLVSAIKEAADNILTGQPLTLRDERSALKAKLLEALEKRWEGWQTDKGIQPEQVLPALLEYAGRRATRRRRQVRLQEIFLIGAAILVAGGLLWGTRFTASGPTPGPSIPATQFVTRVVSIEETPTPQISENEPGPAVAPVVVQAGPLDLNSDSGTILKRLAQAPGLWQTLWLDTKLTFYGAQGRFNKPSQYRLQIWLDHGTNAVRVLSGPLGNHADEMVLTGVGGEFWAELRGVPPFRTVPLMGGETLRGPYLSTVALYLPILRNVFGDSYIAEGEGLFFGRKALRVGQYDSAGKIIATLWLDEITGVPIMQRQYDPTNRGQLLLEAIPYADAIDQVFPQDIFDPNSSVDGTFAQDILNDPLVSNYIPPPAAGNVSGSTLPLQGPPAGFDPGDQPLAFEFGQIFRRPVGYRSRDVAYYRMEVYTPQYHLGNTEFISPWNMICSRSPDGRMLAYGDKQPLLGIGPLRWLDLSTMQVDEWQPGGEATNFAFSPDNRQLAVFVRRLPYGRLLLLDLATHEEYGLVDIEDASSLVWSPDGDYLAFIGRTSTPAFNDNVMVVDVHRDEIIYEKSIDYGYGNSRDWPMLKWGVNFPVEMGGLESCSRPPGSEALAQYTIP